MKRYKSPKVSEMIEAYMGARAAGLNNVMLGNVGIFASSEQDYNLLKKTVGTGNY
jgi:hypothetical protein